MLRVLSPAIRKPDRYVVALVVLIVLFLIRSGILILLGAPTTVALLLLGVLISAWYGGLGPGLLVTFLGVTMNFFLFARSSDGLDFFVSIASDILVGVCISLIGENRLQAANERREFIAMVGHELKNPLAAILNYADLIRIPQSESMHPQYAAHIEKETRSAAKLISDLSDLAQYDMGKLHFDRQTFDVKEVLQEAVDAQTKRTSHAIKLSSPQNACLLQGDRIRIRQVLDNLIGNAIKYSPGAQEVHVSLSCTDGWARIAVRDFGIGMRDRDKKQVFNRFFRSQQVQSLNIDGMGLGLSIARRIIAYHKGDITATSEPGKGSVFTVHLPT